MKFVRVSYFFLFAFGLLMCGVGRWAKDSLASQGFHWLFHELTGNPEAVSAQVITRMSFIFFMTHVLLALLTCGASGDYPGFFKAVHRRLLWVKIIWVILWVFLLVWFIPNWFFTGWGYVSAGISSLYWCLLWLQAVLLSYRISNGIFNKMGESACAKVLLIFMLLFLFAIPVVFVGLAMSWFVPPPVSLSPWAPGVYLSLAVLGLVISFCFVDISILSAAGSAFAAGFTLLSLYRDQRYQVNGVAYLAAEPGWYGSFVNWMNVVLLVFTVLEVSTRDVSFRVLYKGALGIQEESFGFDSGSDDEDSAEPSYHYWLYHVLMACAATSWPAVMGAVTEHIEVAFYAKVVPMILTQVIFIWTMIAPKILKDREF